jgi:transcriptional regulator with XRE-family HTH domain
MCGSGAERFGVSSRYVRSIERARVSANVTVLGKIADRLGAESAELLKIPSGRARLAP